MNNLLKCMLAFYFCFCLSQELRTKRIGKFLNLFCYIIKQTLLIYLSELLK